MFFIIYNHIIYLDSIIDYSLVYYTTNNKAQINIKDFVVFNAFII